MTTFWVKRSRLATCTVVGWAADLIQSVPSSSKEPKSGSATTRKFIRYTYRLKRGVGEETHSGERYYTPHVLRFMCRMRCFRKMPALEVLIFYLWYNVRQKAFTKLCYCHLKWSLKSNSVKLFIKSGLKIPWPVGSSLWVWLDIICDLILWA